jgi:hypothetical protein
VCGREDDGFVFVLFRCRFAHRALLSGFGSTDQPIEYLIRAYFGILRQLPDGGAAWQPAATTPLLM